MRVIFVVLFWMIALIIFNSIDFTSKLKKDALDVYLKEYYTRLAYIFKDKILKNNIYLLDACNNTTFIQKIQDFYKKYKIKDIRAIVGINVSTSKMIYQEPCYRIKGSYCLCVYDEFSRVVQKEESIEVENVRTVKINASDIPGVKEIIIWYYK